MILFFSGDHSSLNLKSLRTFETKLRSVAERSFVYTTLNNMEDKVYQVKAVRCTRPSSTHEMVKTSTRVKSFTGKSSSVFWSRFLSIKRHSKCLFILRFGEIGSKHTRDEDFV